MARPVHRETEVKSTGKENGGLDKGHIPIIETDPHQSDATASEKVADIDLNRTRQCEKVTCFKYSGKSQSIGGMGFKSQEASVTEQKS